MVSWTVPASLWPIRLALSSVASASRSTTMSFCARVSPLRVPARMARYGWLGRASVVSWTAPGAIITNPSGTALQGDHLHVDGNVLLRAGFTANGCGGGGAVRLTWAHIGGQLDCSGATFANPSGTALWAGALQVTGSVYLRAGSTDDPFTADGVGEKGTVRLVGARIGGQLNCSGATITNLCGPALHGEHLQVDGNVRLNTDFIANGGGDGAVRLAWAHVGGELNCSGATITNSSGPALRAGSLHVAGSLFLSAGFTADGVGELGAVRLSGAHIGRQLDCSGATITNPSGPALHGERLQVDGDVVLNAGFAADGDGELGSMRLSGAHIGGQLDCSSAIVTSKSDPLHRWTLDGLTYPRLPLDPPGKGTAGWLDLLQSATPSYAAQPYQQLASVYRAAGHDRDVRQILIAQRQAQCARGVLTGRERLWARITGIILGYGYQSWRALLFLLGIVIISILLTITLGAHGALIHPPDPKNPTAATVSCTVAERIGVGLEVGAPFLDTHARDSCTTTRTTTGTGLSYSIWGLQLLTGILAALFIAGFTDIVRKT